MDGSFRYPGVSSSRFHENGLTIVGSPLGIIDGLEDGSLLGLKLGVLDGFDDGSEEGSLVGSSLGIIDGLEDGSVLGLRGKMRGHEII